MSTQRPVIVALSGGVDSAAVALMLRDAGRDVQCLHMTNWEDDGYCDAARDFQDARRVCQQLGVPLHRVNFATEYREQVFANFLDEHRKGRTPNPDVLCNREIKFGVMREYAHRLGGAAVATGHYARLARDADATGGGAGASAGPPRLLKGVDPGKDQSYFLHAVAPSDFDDVLFPLGDLRKTEVRALAHAARLAVADKKDSTGICFIGERPFADFLHQYLPETPGAIRDDAGVERGVHRGIAYYTLGQRHGLSIGGVADGSEEPWYVAGKDAGRNELLVVQGNEHPLLYQDWLAASESHWRGAPPPGWAAGRPFRCHAKIRYRQPDQACSVVRTGDATLEVSFDQPQRLPTPGQYVVFYDGDVCLGGATIERGARGSGALRAAG